MVKLNNIENLVNNVVDKMSQGVVTPRYTLYDICEAMKFNYNVFYYIDANKLFNKIQEHKLLEWFKLSFTVSYENENDDEPIITFYKYLNKSSNPGHYLGVSKSIGNKVQFRANGEVWLDDIECLCTDIELVENVNYIVSEKLIQREIDNDTIRLSINRNELVFKDSYNTMLINNKIISNVNELIPALKEFFAM